MVYKNNESKNLLGQTIQDLKSTFSSSFAECGAGVGFTDPNLENFKDKVNEEIEKMVASDSRVRKVDIMSGLRGVRYFVEFPIVVKNFDAYSLQKKV